MQSILTPYWTVFRDHPEQIKYWTSEKKYNVIVAGRGSGKTEIARRKIVRKLAFKKPWPNPLYAYCLPTYAQAKKVAWRPLLNLIPNNWIRNGGINLSDMSIETVFGSTLYVMGMDKPQRMEGLQFDGVVLDESCDQKPGVFNLTVVPTLSHRDGYCDRIGVPKRDGVGRVDFRMFFEKGLFGDPNIQSLYWRSESVLTEEQIKVAKSTMSDQDYDEQYNAVWVDVGGIIYYSFASDNIDSSVHYNPDEVIYVGADFNVNPMCWVLAHRYGDNDDTAKIEVFDEVFLTNTNTEAALNHLYSRYSNHTSGWRFYCDASSTARKTSSGKTDYIIIKNDDRFIEKYVFFPENNPKQKDRYQTVNAALKNAADKRRTKIHSDCKHLINDFRLVAYKKGTLEIENYSGTDIGHMSDAFGYMIMRVLPMRIKSTASPAIYTVSKY